MVTLPRYLREILFLLGEDRRKLPWLGIAVVVSSVVDSLGIWLIGPFVALAVEPHRLETFAVGRTVHRVLGPISPQGIVSVLGVGLIVLFVVKACVGVGTQYLLARFARRQQVRLRSRLLDAFQRMPYERHLLSSSADSIESIVHHVNTFSVMAFLVMMRLGAEACVVAVLLGLLAYTSLESVLVLLVLLGAAGFAYERVFRRRVREMGREISIAQVRMMRTIHHALEGLKEIRVLGRESYFLSEMEAGARQSARATTQQKIVQAVPRYLTETVVLTFVIVVVLIAQAQGKDLASIAPMLATFGVAGLRILPSTNLFLTGLNQLRAARYPVHRLYRTMRDVEETPGDREPERCASAVVEFSLLELRGVRFSYPNSAEPALDGIELVVRRGESIGFIGPSGSGKTTVLDVVLGLLEPQVGEVLFNGRPLREDRGAWLQQVGYLPQMVFLIDDTVRANVALGVTASEIDDERVRAALRSARLDEVVQRMPLGLDTTLGERGVRLSGGQRQRIALARAFYHGRDVLVMDESTSALDNETERHIVEEIRRLRGKKTLVVIAHRMSTVRHCDRIYRFERGRIVQSGSFEEVVAASART